MAARRGMGKDFIVIWVDRNIDPSNEDCQNTLTQLRHVANEIQECSTAEQCITSLKKTIKRKHLSSRL
ncbi:unnamed protein product, partial [Rotaria magnacalcarata]